MADDDAPRSGDMRKPFLKRETRQNFPAMVDAKFEKAWDSLTDESE
jgi:hypothetical protein